MPVTPFGFFHAYNKAGIVKSYYLNTKTDGKVRGLVQVYKVKSRGGI